MTESAFIRQVALFDYDVDTDDDETVTDVVIVAKVARLSGPPTVIIVCSNGTDIVTQLGLLAAAQQINEQSSDWQQNDE